MVDMGFLSLQSLTIRESKVGKLCGGCYLMVSRGTMQNEIIGDCLKTHSCNEIRSPVAYEGR